MENAEGWFVPIQFTMLEGCLYLRNYPAKFGDAIVRLREDLVASRIHHSKPFASASRCWNCPCRSAWPGPVFDGQSDGGGQIFEVGERTKSPRPLESHNSQTLKLQGCRFPALRSLSGNISKLTNDRRILRFRVSNIFEPIYFLKKLNGYFSDLNCFWWLFYAPNEGYPKFFPSKPIFLSTHPIFLSTKLRKNPVNIAKPGFWQPVINP